MAAFHHLQRSTSRIYHLTDQHLPTGSCNFRDLSIGQRAPTCGCKRFWLNEGHISSGGAERGWCFCGHHACFHSASSQQPRSQEPATQPASQLSQQYGPSEGYVQVGAETVSQALRAPISQPQATGLGIRPETPVQSQSINTRLWDALNAFARDQEDGPPQDALPSTACPSVAGEPRPSPTRMLQERAQQRRSMGPPVNMPTFYPHVAGSEDYSATEVATPSLNGTPDLRAFAAQAPPIRPSPQPSVLGRATSAPPRNDQLFPGDSGNLSHQGPDDVPPASSAPVPHLTSDTMQNMLQVIQRRVDALESLSFSHIPLDEVHDKFENFEVRILDLEQWRQDSERRAEAENADGRISDLEQWRQEADQRAEAENAEEEERLSSKRRRLLPTETSSFSSDGSFDSAAAAHTEAAVLATLAANAETNPRIDALESRVADLESVALPSFSRPWHVQVVLLPWGRQLRGIWFSALEATQHSLKSSTQVSEEWNGTQPAASQPFRSFESGAWTTESIQAWAKDTQEWLSPKACGPSGTVFQRLASRGLVQEIRLTSSSSHHVISAINAAFSNFLRVTFLDWTQRTGTRHFTNLVSL
jgi:hypothetical protein